MTVAQREQVAYAVQAVRTTVVLLVKKCLVGTERHLWRRYLLDRFAVMWGRSLPPRHRPAVLLFVNAGEILGLNVFCATLRQLYPSHTLILAIDNHEAYIAGARLGIGDLRIFAPWDFAWAGRRLQRRFGVEVAVFVSKIFHPAISAAWRRNGVVVGLVSGHFTPEATSLPVVLPFRRRLFALRAYEELDFIGMQTADQRDELRKYVDRDDMVALGNVRADVSHAGASAADLAEFHRLLHLAPATPVIVAAATRDDEGLIFEAFQQVLHVRPDARLVLVPRHIEAAAAIAALGAAKGLDIARLSACRAPASVIVVDTSIMLARLYAVATVVIFARTFHHRGGWTNILEPAYHAKPIVFGDQLKLWPEGLEALRRQHPAVCVPADARALAAAVLKFLTDAGMASVVGEGFRRLTDVGAAVAIANARFIHDRAVESRARRAIPSTPAWPTSSPSSAHAAAPRGFRERT